MSVLAVADFIKLQLFIQWPALHFPKRAAVKSKNRLASHLGKGLLVPMLLLLLHLL